MAKPKSPLLSLGARGTIGDTLTFQKRGQDTIVRHKPIPAYRYTLPQAYHRWLYQDYAYLWTQQSEATRRKHTSDGSRYHLTGFQYWMKNKLTNLSDIAAVWHLDYIAASQVRDSSKNNNHGTVYGATPVDGPISKALYFDGLDDYLNCGSHESLFPSAALTLELWLKPAEDLTTTPNRGWMFFSVATGQGYALSWMEDGGVLRFWTGDGPSAFAYLGIGWSDKQWHHLAVVYDGIDAKSYFDGVLNTTDPTVRPSLGNSGIALYIARYSGSYFNADLDEVRIYNRVLDATEVQRHAERRYP